MSSRRRSRLNPQLAVAHATYSLYLTTVGRHDEAIEQSRTAQSLDPLSLLVNMTVCWALHFAGRSEEAVRETRRTRELSPGFQEAGNLLMHLYEILGRFEDAARIPLEQPVYGVRMDAAGLLDAYRSGGEEAYLRKRIEILEATRAEAPAGIHFGFASLHARLGEADKALDHLEQLVDARVSASVFIGVDPCLRSAARSTRDCRRCSRGWVCPGFSTAYSVDMIGTGTPARAARRTTAPCSASTSIRFPIDRSISSDDRIVGGSASR